jgi:multicomponent Na+:H+ antiporter subunit G
MASAPASTATYLGDALVLLGLLALTVGVYGVIQLPNTFLKLHASSAAVFLGGIPLLAATVATGDPAIICRAVLIVALLLLTTPISAHAVTKAAYQRGEGTDPPGVADERRGRPPAAHGR